MRSNKRIAGVLAATGLVTLLLTGGARAQDPPRGDAVANSQKARCLSNMKQLSLAMLMYAADYDDTFPPAGKWADLLRPYYKNGAVLTCPADGTATSYAMNQNIAGAPMKAIASPATTVALFESNLHRKNAAGTAGAAASPGRHTGGNHYGFVDGHVKWYEKPPSFGTPYKAPKKVVKPATKKRR